MRKRLILIICLSLLSCLIVFSACNKDKNYQTKVYEYIPHYKSTTCNILKDKNIELHVENSVSNSKDEISDLINLMQDDYSILTSVFNLDTQIKCYTFDTLSEFDFALLAKCIGETTLKDNSYKSRITFPYATNAICKIYSCTSKGGNVLTYPEAYAFTYYLIEKYGFNNVLKCCIDYNFDGVFGSDYSVIMDEFMQNIQ